MNTAYRAFFHDLRGRLLTGAIAYDQAEEESASIIDDMNKQGKEIARKHGKHFTPFIFSKLIR
jgi:hypothetical protein